MILSRFSIETKETDFEHVTFIIFLQNKIKPSLITQLPCKRVPYVLKVTGSEMSASFTILPGPNHVREGK